MRRLSRAVALTAVTLALATAGFGCKKDEGKKTDEAPAEAKTSDTPAAAPTDPGTPATTTPPGADPAATAPAEPGAAPAAPAAPAQRPASVTDEHIAIADKVVDATNKFADDLDKAKADCKKATEVIKNQGSALKAAMENTDKLQTQLNSDPAAMQWFQQTYGPKMMSAVGKLGGVFTQCGKDKDFEAAFKSLELGAKSSAPPPSAPAAPAEPNK